MQRRNHQSSPRPANPFSRGGARLTYSGDSRYGPQTAKYQSKRSGASTAGYSCMGVVFLYFFLSWMMGSSSSTVPNTPIATMPSTPSVEAGKDLESTPKPTSSSDQSHHLGYKPRLEDNQEEQMPYHKLDVEDEEDHHAFSSKKMEDNEDEPGNNENHSIEDEEHSYHKRTFDEDEEENSHTTIAPPLGDEGYETKTNHGATNDVSNNPDEALKGGDGATDLSTDNKLAAASNEGDDDDEKDKQIDEELKNDSTKTALDEEGAAVSSAETGLTSNKDDSENEFEEREDHHDPPKLPDEDAEENLSNASAYVESTNLTQSTVDNSTSNNTTESEDTVSLSVGEEDPPQLPDDEADGKLVPENVTEKNWDEAGSNITSNGTGIELEEKSEKTTSLDDKISLEEDDEENTPPELPEDEEEDDGNELEKKENATLSSEKEVSEETHKSKKLGDNDLSEDTSNATAKNDAEDESPELPEVEGSDTDAEEKNSTNFTEQIGTGFEEEMPGNEDANDPPRLPDENTTLFDQNDTISDVGKAEEDEEYEPPRLPDENSDVATEQKNTAASLNETKTDGDTPEGDEEPPRLTDEESDILRETTNFTADVTQGERIEQDEAINSSQIFGEESNATAKSNDAVDENLDGDEENDPPKLLGNEDSDDTETKSNPSDDKGDIEPVTGNTEMENATDVTNATDATNSSADVGSKSKSNLDSDDTETKSADDKGDIEPVTGNEEMENATDVKNATDATNFSADVDSKSQSNLSFELDSTDNATVPSDAIAETSELIEDGTDTNETSKGDDNYNNSTDNEDPPSIQETQEDELDGASKEENVTDLDSASKASAFVSEDKANFSNDTDKENSGLTDEQELTTLEVKATTNSSVASTEKFEGGSMKSSKDEPLDSIGDNETNTVKDEDIENTEDLGKQESLQIAGGDDESTTKENQSEANETVKDTPEDQEKNEAEVPAAEKNTTEEGATPGKEMTEVVQDEFPKITEESDSQRLDATTANSNPTEKNTSQAEAGKAGSTKDAQISSLERDESTIDPPSTSDVADKEAANDELGSTTGDKSQSTKSENEENTTDKSGNLRGSIKSNEDIIESDTSSTATETA